MFRFHDPWVLGLLLLLPLLLWVQQRWKAQRRGSLRFSAVEAVRATGEGLSSWASRVPMILRLLVLVTVIVALARPQTGVTSENLLTQGIDIVLAMDVSSSMLAEDLEPNRLEASKEVAAEFVRGRRNDRIGLVAFAGEAYTQAPLTLDPWRRFTQGWSDDYQGEGGEGLQEWSWQIEPGQEPGIRVHIQASTSFSAHTFKGAQPFFAHPENPNLDYPPGHFLPFPTALIEIQPQGNFWIKISIKKELLPFPW